MHGLVNPDLFVVARELRGVSQFDLALQAQISQGHLSKIENGLVQPDQGVLDRIADVLGFPAIFFFQQGRIYGRPLSVHPVFRKPASVSKEAINRITAEVNVRLLNINQLMKAVEVKSTLPLPRYDLEISGESPADVAALVRRAWYVPNGPIKNLTSYVEQAGIVVVPCDFIFASVDGVALNAPDQAPCIFLNKHRPADRTRFSLAHELGHLVMHRQPTLEMEDEANEFASALLMPAQDFISSCARKIDLAELARLKMIWRVSMQAALYRIQQLDLISRNQASYLWRQMSALGYRKGEPPSTNLPAEAVSVLPRMLELHLGTLGYSTAELAQSLRLSQKDFEALYEVPGTRPSSGRLRVIK